MSGLIMGQGGQRAGMERERTALTRRKLFHKTIQEDHGRDTPAVPETEMEKIFLSGKNRDKINYIHIDIDCLRREQP